MDSWGAGLARNDLAHLTIRSTMTPPAIPLKNRRLAALLAYLVPGLGHFYQGRTAKGLLYLVSILGLYLVGFTIGEGRNVYWSWINPLRDPDNFRLYFLGQFWVGIGALPALLQATLIHYGYAPILHGFMAAPVLDPSMSAETRAIIEEVTRQSNALYPKYGKLVEIGALYTTIAGLLNILAIYDAYDGPALQDEEPEASTPSEKAASLQSSAATGAQA